MGLPVDHLKDLQLSLRTVFLDKNNGKYISLGATTDTAVLDRDGRTDLVKGVATGEEERLASVALVTTDRADFFFVTEDKSTQSSRIFRYDISDAKEVYSHSQRIVAFQLSPSND